MNAAALAYLGAGIGIAGAALGAGIGIGNLAAPAMEGTARQPEAANDIRTSMIISAALIEGVAIIAEIVAILLVFTTG
ncbi:MAG: ATP synthase F0 subunit C [Bacteroidetes bacterium QS_9_68_14]|nr:MAG: ATP synthase F0 subunit C [Bacteroidetes bacterium QS_9_68_14]